MGRSYCARRACSLVVFNRRLSVSPLVLASCLLSCVSSVVVVIVDGSAALVIVTWQLGGLNNDVTWARRTWRVSEGFIEPKGSPAM